MAQGEFVWCDLATFEVDQALDYYKGLFGWELVPEKFSDGSRYYYASCFDEITAGLYEMPDEFRDDGMSSFWMSYVGVDDIIEACQSVRELGGKVVLGPASFGRGAAIAMIEDPCGACFTLLSGTYLQPRSTKMVDGGHFWNELFTTDLDRSVAFYSGLFGWKSAETDGQARLLINNLAGSLVTAFQDCSVTPAPLDKPQWTVSFATHDLDSFVKRLKVEEQDKLIWVKNRKAASICAADPNGAIFIVSQVNQDGGWFR